MPDQSYFAGYDRESLCTYGGIQLGFRHVSLLSSVSTISGHLSGLRKMACTSTSITSSYLHSNGALVLKNGYLGICNFPITLGVWHVEKRACVLNLLALFANLVCAVCRTMSLFHSTCCKKCL